MRLTKVRSLPATRWKFLEQVRAASDGIEVGLSSHEGGRIELLLQLGDLLLKILRRRFGSGKLLYQRALITTDAPTDDARLT